MKTFKQIDLIIQLTAITFFTILSLIKLDKTFVYAYIITCLLQLISMIAHALDKNYWYGTRKIYSIICFTIVACMLAAFYIYFLGIIFYIMLFAAPIMAVYYVVLCAKEYRLLNERPLAQLK